MAAEPEYCGTREAAMLLGLSVERVRQLHHDGILPALRTTTGVRLFRVTDVRQLARDRQRAGRRRSYRSRA